MNNPYTREPIRGFSLIEVAVVLFIITLVMSGIISLVNASLTNRQIEVTAIKQTAIKTALINFIARNSRMPCPALLLLLWRRGQRTKGSKPPAPEPAPGFPSLVPHRTKS